MSTTQDWLIDFFAGKSNLQQYELPRLLEINYFDEGLIDSFGIIDLIMKIEENFKIKLPNNAFQERRFSTIKGLAEIIDEQKSK